MKIVIKGEPISKKRHRSCVVKGRMWQYDVQEKEKGVVVAKLREGKVGNELREASSVKIKFKFYIGWPRSLSKVERGRIEWGNRLCNGKPDIDNLMKFYLDCMNKEIFEDDKLVTKVEVMKEYSKDPRTEIEISVLRKAEEDLEMDEVFGEFSVEDVRDMVEINDRLRDLWVTRESVFVEEEDEQEINKAISGTLLMMGKRYGEKFVRINKKMKEKRDAVKKRKE